MALLFYVIRLMKYIHEIQIVKKADLKLKDYQLLMELKQ